MKISARIGLLPMLFACACSGSPDQEKTASSTTEALSLASSHGWDDEGPLVVTSTNQAANALLVYDRAGSLLQTLPTSGAGGVGGNAGGVTAHDGMVAAVNFGSRSVSLFARKRGRLELSQVLSTASSPVSVALDEEHVYVLGTTTVESYRRHGQGADARADGLTALVRSDGSAAQVGVLEGELLITEKSGIVETVRLDRGGAVAGPASAVAIAPEDSNTPLGLVTNGRSGYVTLAHSDEIGLIRDDTLRAIVATGSGFPTGPGQQAPCWIARSGSFLFTANSPSHSITRLVATPLTLAIDELVAAKTTGTPTDIATQGRLLAVLEGNGNGISHVTQFAIGADGSLTQTISTEIAAAANGLAIVDDD
jgi:hypothetical protein